jgi:hypothetical protein
MQSDDEPNSGDGTLGRITLKQVRVSRAEAEARAREGSTTSASSSGVASERKPANNPMNRLVPYLDLFDRLSDDELSRLARAPLNAVEGLRQQIEELNRALERYVDLLIRLNDDELARLTGASAKTIRFWRLSQPRHLQGEVRRTSEPAREPTSSQSSGSMRREDALSESSASSPSSPSTTGPRPSVRTGPNPPLRSAPEPSASGSATFVMDPE